MDVHIKGSAEDVRLGDIDEVYHKIERILLPTDGSAPSVAATQYAVMLAKTFGATVKAIFVDTGLEPLSIPKRSSTRRSTRASTPRSKDWWSPRRCASATVCRVRSRSCRVASPSGSCASPKSGSRPDRGRRHGAHRSQAHRAGQRGGDRRQGSAYSRSCRESRVIAGRSEPSSDEGGAQVGETTAQESAVLSADGRQIQHGDHIDTIESVDAVFRAQRKLSFTYGAIFFAVTLGIPRHPCGGRHGTR